MRLPGEVGGWARPELAVRPQVSRQASRNHLAQVSRQAARNYLAQVSLGLTPVCALHIVYLGSPVPSWASVSPYVQHVQPATKEPYPWMESEGHALDQREWVGQRGEDSC